jgi:hypothetical protein
MKLQTDIQIRLVTDKQQLKSKGHDMPVIELYNDIIDTWVSAKDLSFSTLEYEIDHINKVTEQHLTHTGGM